MRDYNETIASLKDAAYDYEEDLSVSVATTSLEREDEDGWDSSLETFYVARVDLGGTIHGVINRDGMEEALDRAAELVLEGEDPEEEEKDEYVSTRHIEALQSTVQELGFDRAVALLERLNQ